MELLGGDLDDRGRNPVSGRNLGGVIWCRFIFSGKNDELTPDF